MCVLSRHIALRHSSCLKHLHVFRTAGCNVAVSRTVSHIQGSDVRTVYGYFGRLARRRELVKTERFIPARTNETRDAKYVATCVGGLLLRVPDSPQACSAVRVRKL